MTDDGPLSGQQNALLFTAFGVIAIVAGLTVLDGWLPLWTGTVLVVGGVASLSAQRSGVSRRGAAPLQALSTLVVGGLFVWRGYQLGSPFWLAFGLGIAIPLAVLMVFPSRLALVCGILMVTFGGAGILLVATGALLTGLVLVGWGVGFAWVGYQNWPSASN